MNTTIAAQSRIDMLYQHLLSFQDFNNKYPRKREYITSAYDNNLRRTSKSRKKLFKIEEFAVDDVEPSVLSVVLSVLLHSVVLLCPLFHSPGPPIAEGNPTSSTVNSSILRSFFLLFEVLLRLISFERVWWNSSHLANISFVDEMNSTIAAQSRIDMLYPNLLSFQNFNNKYPEEYVTNAYDNDLRRTLKSRKKLLIMEEFAVDDVGFPTAIDGLGGPGGQRGRPPSGGLLIQSTSVV
ncbi:hypothetical protein QYF36_021357 [Acer negundo]|nr:hypothetical protein QYF36_021357 [Acer negundo]